MPFIQCETPEEAKRVLDSMKNTVLGRNVHRLIFKKVTNDIYLHIIE
jgi:hypothetical protein